MDHEPCKSRGDCYHADNGRIGAFKTNETWGKTPEAREAFARGGRISGPIVWRKWNKTPEGREARVRAARKTNATWGKTPEAHEARVRGGHIGGPIGGRKTNATWGKTPEAYEARSRGGHIGGTKTVEIFRQKPNRQEATIAALLMTFHPDVWADIIWQKSLPNGLRGVPDLRHPIKIIGEYDGGGHNAFEDRSAGDAAKDIERHAVGYVVIRETDPYVLVAKFVFAVKEAM